MATAKYTRGKDGYFTARVWDGTYRGRKKHYVPLRTRKSSRALEELVRAYNDKVASRQALRKIDATFLAYSRAWADVYKAQSQENTRIMYENIIEKHFSILGMVRLQDIDRIHLQMLLNHADGHPRTQQQIYMTFKQVLQSAVFDRLFAPNVVDDIFHSIDRPKYSPNEKRPLCPYELSALFSADFSDMDRVFVYILYGCGLRRGEALALTVFDVNLNTHELTVSKAHAIIKGDVIQKDPKTSRGFRTVPIPDKVFPAIQSWVELRRMSGKAFLFSMRNGSPMTKSSYDKMWTRIRHAMQDVSKENICGLTAHVFRHNYCTNLCYQIPAISIKHIAYLMGDTEKMVLEVYNHVVMEKENATSAINAALS